MATHSQWTWYEAILYFERRGEITLPFDHPLNYAAKVAKIIFDMYPRIDPTGYDSVDLNHVQYIYWIICQAFSHPREPYVPQPIFPRKPQDPDVDECPNMGLDSLTGAVYFY